MLSHRGKTAAAKQDILHDPHRMCSLPSVSLPSAAKSPSPFLTGAGPHTLGESAAKSPVEAAEEQDVGRAEPFLVTKTQTIALAQQGSFRHTRNSAKFMRYGSVPCPKNIMGKNCYYLEKLLETPGLFFFFFF